ncbi:hypothetical protein CSW64_16600 [Caulobacter mirabilis]|uniref:Uncharacterized protein n=1 Tax=Caulobacter mirabilis TaxID=69666 RepID=A0A2D2B4C6_9CAUL|nr:hypothetical protein CSW64_16600 [Caulobacter mirabilis]
MFTGLVVLTAAFQVALALGAPWGELAMGGGVKGVLPLGLRLAALAQAALLGVMALVMLSRAGLLLTSWEPASRYLVWVAVAMLAISTVLNLATPSTMERLIWAPVAGALLIAGLRVALGR